jgi:hypothetical protein
MASPSRPEPPGYQAAVTPPASLARTSAKATDEEFFEDIKAILSGQKAFDPTTKKTVDRDRLARPQSAAVSNGAAPATPPAPEAKNEHAIFDRIRESMTFANAYDLGTVELKNRFADFDRSAELEQRAAEAKKPGASRAPVQPPAAGPSVDSVDFIQDLDAIRRVRTGGYIPASSRSMSSDPLDVDVMYRMFIPSPLIDGRHLKYLGNVFGGDGRDFSYDSGTSRGQVHATVHLSPGGGIKDIDVIDSAWAGTTKYNPDDAIAVAGKPDWWRDKKAGARPIESMAHPDGDVLKIYRGVSGGTQRSIEAMADNASILTMEAVGANPLQLGAPAIDSDISILLRINGDQVQAKVIGQHDGFPAHEVYVNRTLIYSYDPVAASNGPEALSPPMDIDARTDWVNVASLAAAAATP